MSLVEKCWMITSNVSVIAVLIITGICFGIFVRPYMKKKKEAIAVSTVYITVMLVLYIVPPQIDNFSAYLLGIMAAFIVMYAEDRTNIYQKIFCIVFIAGGVWLINQAFVYKKDEMSIKEMVMLMIPSLVGVTGYGILQYYLNIYEKEQLGQELVLNQVSDMEKHIGEVEKLYQDIRSLRHDMGNHIQILEHLVAHNNMDDAAEYMEHLQTEWNDISPEIKTGSPVIDVILMEKMREAQEKRIRFTSDFHYPENTKLNAFDMSVIMNNALNNCMENVSGDDPYISVSSFRKKSIFMITINFFSNVKMPKE